MTRVMRGDVDGISLSSFQVGGTYDVSPSIATYLILSGSAEPIIGDTSAVENPIIELRLTYPPTRAMMDVAADATLQDMPDDEDD